MLGRVPATGEMGGKLSVLMMTYALLVCQPSFRREREREILGKVFDHIGLGSYGVSEVARHVELFP